MKYIYIISIFAILIAVNLSTTVVNAVENSHSLKLKNSAKTRLLIKFTQKENKEEVLKRHQVKQIAEIPQIDVTVIETYKNKDDLIRDLNKEAVEYVEVDSVAEAFSNDPLYYSQWAFPIIKWDQIDITSVLFNLTSPIVTIAVVDTGVDYSHPDLSGKVDTINDWDYVNNDNDALDDNLHGTHVAGIAAAATNNNIGVAGISINSSKILPVKVLDSRGSGYYSWIASGITYATDKGAKVINLSLGGNIKSSTLEKAVNYAINKGALVIAAAGNSNNSSPTYPAYYSNSMAVWSSNQSDYKSSFSSYGKWVDIGAPGSNILSTVPLSLDHDSIQDGYYYGSGTSMATPHVAGLAGLLFTKKPTWSVSQIRAKIESTADPVPDRLFKQGHLGKGRINIQKALSN